MGERKDARSHIMASIRSANTKIEKAIREILLSLNIDFDDHPGVLYGKPDFALRNEKIAIFCDGDFWHGYEIETNPRFNVGNNREFWLRKIRANIERDKKVNKELNLLGWNVIRFWEHDINSNPERCRKIIIEGIGGKI